MSNDYIPDWAPPLALVPWVQKMRQEDRHPTMQPIEFDARIYMYRVVQDEGMHKYLEVCNRRDRSEYAFSDDRWEWAFDINNHRFIVAHLDTGDLDETEEFKNSTDT